jgi:hypothetical protein
MADQLLDHQVLEHLLTVLLAITQVKILQDEIVGLLRTHAQRLFTGISGVDILDTQFSQHGPNGAAEIREIIDDQKTLLVIRQHRGFPGNLRRPFRLSASSGVPLKQGERNCAFVCQRIYAEAQKRAKYLKALLKNGIILVY